MNIDDYNLHIDDYNLHRYLLMMIIIFWCVKGQHYNGINNYFLI